MDPDEEILPRPPAEENDEQWIHTTEPEVIPEPDGD